jgi:hypothetical protein
MIPAAEKEYKLLKLCSELATMVMEVPADFIPRTKEVRDAVAYFRAKKPEAPAEAETKPKPKRKRLSDEEKKKRKREYMREYMKKYLQRPGIAEKNKQRVRAWRACKKAEAKTA